VDEGNHILALTYINTLNAEIYVCRISSTNINYNFVHPNFNLFRCTVYVSKGSLVSYPLHTPFSNLLRNTASDDNHIHELNTSARDDGLKCFVSGHLPGS